MKSIKFTFILILVISSFIPVADTKAQSVSLSFSTFQQELSPYGRWVNNPRFGEVWICNESDFRPYYTDGHWEYTNYGWSWESDYDWGWAPFHYGRWEYDPYDGWMWIPGYEWGAAWVSWSSYDDYYGWAPLGYGVNINVSFGSIPYSRWTFIPRRNICDRDINRYYVSPERNVHFRNAVVINNYYNGSGRVGRYVRGPERRDVEHYTHNRIEEHRIDYNDHGRNRGNNVRNDDGGNRRNNEHNTQIDNRRNTGSDNRGNNRNDNQRNHADVNRSNNSTPPVNNTNRPRRETNNNPGRTDNNPGRRQNNNRVYQNGNSQNNSPQRQPQSERPPQQREPQMQQRNIERRAESNTRQNTQRSTENNQRQNSGNGRKRNGN